MTAKIKQFFGCVLKEGYTFFPAISMAILCIISFYTDISPQMVFLLAISSVLLFLGGFFINRKVRTKDHFSEKIMSVPALIVSPSGEIQSTNGLGLELVQDSDMQLGTILQRDGFDEGAAYRLLNVTETNIEKSMRYIYKSSLIDKDTILIVRSLNHNILTDEQDVDIAIIDDKEFEQENLIDKFADFPIGYFEKHQGKVSSDNMNSDVPILEMNQTLKDWVQKDTELLNHLKKFGSATSKKIVNNSIPKDDDLEVFQYFNVYDSMQDDTLKIFQFLISEDETHDKMQGFVLPIEFDKNNQLFGSQEQPQENDLATDIFKNTPVATVILDDKNQIVDFNQAFLELIELDELKYQNIKDYFPEGERPKFDAQSDTQNLEIFMVNPKERILNLKLTPTNDNKYKICYFTDISSEKSLEQKFNQAQKMQAVGQLAGGVAHDFNNLLTAILGHTELLINRFNASDSVYSDLLQVRNNANRAGNLVRQLLAFSRRQTLKPEIITLTDFLPDLSRMIERLSGDRIILKTNYAPGLKPIKADLTQLEQVIINLAVNARDAMEEKGGALTISTQNVSFEQSVSEGHDIMPAAEYVKISVSDTGHGMNEEIRAKIFEPFFTTKEQGKGTGLGLSTVYGIVKQSGGFIFVDSKVNKGTTFRIYFPITQETKEIDINAVANQETEKSDESLVVKAPHTKTILVVEDEEAVRSFAVRALELRGYNILEADCGEEALDIMKDHYESINLVITDVMMPGLSGPEWIKEAQEMKKNFTVIFMSGYTQDYFRDDDAFNLPDLDVTFLSKPFSLKSFTELVDQKLSG